MGTQIRFWNDAYKNEAKSKEAGVPVFDTVPWCEIRVVGEPDTIAGPVHRMQQYMSEPAFLAGFEEFKRNNASEGIIGTPLSKVAWLERGEVETLAYAGIRTLENLAAVSDGAITRIPGGLAMRKRAADMLAAAKSEAPLQQMSDELAKRDDEIRNLKAQITEILASKRKRREAAEE